MDIEKFMMSWQNVTKEQQANNYLKRKEWMKAAELYGELLRNNNTTVNTERTVSYLLSRSECLLELEQHEAVISDCQNVIKLLKDKAHINPTATRARILLVHAFIATKKFDEAESIIREWLSVSRHLNPVKLLQYFHNTKLQKMGLTESALQPLLTKLYAEQRVQLDIPTQAQQSVVILCAYCNTTFQNKSELRMHCLTETHQITIMSDEGRDWYFRPPPRGISADFYMECKNWSGKGSCRFGKQCTEAHGAKELAEWKERYKYRQMKLQRAYEKELFGKSYMEEMLEKYIQSTNPSTIMAEQIEDVDDSCCSELTTTVLSKTSMKRWKFKLKTTKSLHAIALLHDIHRNYFEIESLTETVDGNKLEIPISNGQEWISSVPESKSTEYNVIVRFKTEIYGTFRQSIVFDFGTEPILMKNLCVDVIPAEDARKIKEIKEEISLTVGEKWTEANSEIVPFTRANMETEWNKRLLRLYPSPQLNTFTLSNITVTQDRLTRNNYRIVMHELLYVEELARTEQINKYNLNTELHVVDSYLLSSSSISSSTAKYANYGKLYAYMNITQELSEDTVGGRLILNNCVSVLVKRKDKNQTKQKVYEALIEDKCKNVIYLCLSARTVAEMKLKRETVFRAQIQFQLNRIPYCEWHYAIDKMNDLKLIFPETYIEPQIPWSPQKQWSDKIDSRLNLKQKEAVIAITTPVHISLPPILVIGPFGTGKTFTLAQAIKQLVTQEETKILICTHSNSAADLYIKDYLHPFVKSGHEEARPLRVYYEKRWVTTVSASIREYCLLDHGSGMQTFQIPTKADVDRHRIVVVTLSTSLYLLMLNLPQGYFTHIFLDEAAQAIECEAVMPLSFANESTRIVLAGDHMQLSPELFSKFARERNLHVSLLERLYDHYPATFPCKILLCENYRAHEAIIEYTSELFYEQKLVASGRQPRHTSLYPLTFFTARGEDIQDMNSTAFYNAAEAYEIVERVSYVKNQWPPTWGKFDDRSIGILTPYSDQVFRIRSELRKRRLGNISVERVLNVQGKQFRAIFLSTVRTRRTCTSSTDDDNDYGLLSNSKLLNTAITRAQSLVAVVGDPVALCSVGRCSKVWEKFINTCSENNSLFGITWSFLKNQLDGLELKKTYGLNPLAPEFVPRKFKTESYIRYPTYNVPVIPTVPPATVVPPAPPLPVGMRLPFFRPAYIPPLLTAPAIPWPIFQPPNFMWRLPAPPPPPPQPPFNVVLNLNRADNLQKMHEATAVPPNYVAAKPKSSPQPAPPPLQLQHPTHPERALIQFLDNVHIPETSKANRETLNDLMNLLPENMSLANILMQPPSFHIQWFNYLLMKNGLETAKKFEYLIMMSMKRGQYSLNEPSTTNGMVQPNHNLPEMPYLEQQMVDLHWYDEPINQINFDKPVYLKDNEGVTQQRSPDGDVANGGFGCSYKKESVPLYQRQSKFNYRN